MYKKQRIHFVGIGGIGMSGIATILAHHGHQISGCDADIHQKSVHLLQDIGCSIYEGNNTPACTDSFIDIVVYSTSIPHDNPELVAARARGIPVVHRSEMLAELMRKKDSIAITGAHGKTTTSAMVAHILMQANMDPTVIVGGFIPSIGHNAHYGQGNFLVAEADESDRSLLNLQPIIALVTNIDFEHPETYHDLDDIIQTYRQFLDCLSPVSGIAILCMDDPYLRDLIPTLDKKIISYGTHQQANVRGSIKQITPYTTEIDVHYYFNAFFGLITESLTVGVPGMHNALNALGATAVALDIGIPFATIAQALSTFTSVERRFQYHGTYQGAKVFDDYGHHPTEITCILNLAAMHANKGITVVFQPHRVIRTKILWQQFIDVFMQSSIRNLIITDIYAAGEQPIEGISGKSLAWAIAANNPPFSITYCPYESNHQTIKQQLNRYSQSHDLIIFLGAGTIYKAAHSLMA